MSLWNTPADPKVFDKLLGKFKNDTSITPEELERRINEAMKNCDHNEMQRFGPSYTTRADGTQREFDESICMKCGYSPKTPH